MDCYLITTLCLDAADDYTVTYADEAEAIANFEALVKEQPELVVQVLMTTIDTDEGQATVNRNWRRT